MPIENRVIIFNLVLFGIMAYRFAPAPFLHIGIIFIALAATIAVELIVREIRKLQPNSRS